MNNTKTGYTCPNCQTFHEFSAYVHAHGNIILTHTCPCGEVNHLLGGEVVPEDLDE